MLKQAYEIGVLLALEEEGLTKTAGATHGLKTIAEGAWGKVKNYFTGEGVRGALKDYGEISLHPGQGEALTRLGAKRGPVREALDMLKEHAGGSGSGRAETVLRDIAARLKHAIPPDPKGEALKQVGKSLLPYGVPAAGIGLAAATPSIMSGIYPNF